MKVHLRKPGLRTAKSKRSCVIRTIAKCAIERSPCVLITAPEGSKNTSLQALAHEVRQQLGFPAVVVASKSSDLGSSSSSSSSVCAGATTACPGDNIQSTGSCFTFQQQLELLTCADNSDTYFLVGATAADCVLCAVDHTHGLLQHLGFNPVLVLVGVSSGPALSSDLDLHPAVAAARQAALLGLPAVAACLATTSAGVPVQPAIAATAKLLRDVLALLTGSSSSSYQQQQSARNFPRAHFPFPEEGRWALGVQMALPIKAAASAGGSTHRQPGINSTNAYDCWALGDDNSWLGNTSTNTGAGRHQGKAGQPRQQQQAYDALQRAYADGDVFLCLNVPPIWTEAAGFAATRPGVVWHCRQVLAQQQEHLPVQQCNATNDVNQQQDPRTYNTTSDCSHITRYDDESSSSSSQSVNAGVAASSTTTGRWSHLYAETSSSSENVDSSWFVDRKDLFGRTLPSSSYNSQIPTGSNFVGQDNTRKVVQGLQSLPEIQTAFERQSGSSGRQQQVLSPPQRERQASAVHNIPRSFTVARGTLLSDAAACGDVEAVFSGKAAVTLCQTWPAGHPLSCRDELLLAALDEGPEGMPSWLCLRHQ